MYKRKIYKIGYHSKENFMLYNFNMTFVFVFETLKKLYWFKCNSILFLIPYDSKKKQNKLSNIQRK